ncbi:hypothetical protein W02_09610 [Nitrospira sp. KM1]|uniref:hypothetical protein n=1 Tax=Nitrospira sp. KM1 TaxID=1936990 RepID=UPI0013A768BC|nr:hypothetical protein [Nitrospira sp. KM1]BCA53821.1 hypothetical protein W02_09610 [Nitrospira sp. KM1]
MLKSFPIALLLGAAVLCLTEASGCDGNRATGPYFQDLIHPTPTDTIVYFYRDARPDAPKASDWIYAFDQMIRIDPGGYTFQSIPPGRYLMSLKSKEHADNLWFDFARGQTTFLKWDYARTAAGGYESKLVRVEPQQALQELTACRLMQLDPGGRP